MTSAKRVDEEEALQVLLDHLSGTGSGTWVKVREPDRDSSRALPDYMIRHGETGEKAAVEVTAFGWPPDAVTIQSTMRSVCKEVSKELRLDLHGAFTLHVDELLDVREAGVFSRRRRGRTVADLVTLIKKEGPQMRAGDRRYWLKPFSMYVVRCSHTGEGRLVWGGSNCTVLLGPEAQELQTVIEDNERKFEDFQGIHRWLVVHYLSGGSGLRHIVPNLRLPREIDDLFFIVTEQSQSHVELRISTG